MKITRILSAVSLVGLMASPALADIAGGGGGAGGCSVGGTNLTSSLAGVAMFASGAAVLTIARRISRKGK